MKTDEQRRARELRAEGRLDEGDRAATWVARSSVSLWVRDVQLGDVERRALAARVTGGRLQAARRKSTAARLLRAEYQREGRRLARERDASYAAGCMRYWAEGEKNRCRLSVSNSDVDLLCMFVEFLRKHFDVSPAAMRVHCHLFADHLARQREIEQFWLTAPGLPTTSLGKSVVNTYSRYSQKKRKNKPAHGTCKLTVNSTRIVQTVFGSIQEYGGFDRPE